MLTFREGFAPYIYKIFAQKEKILNAQYRATKYYLEHNEINPNIQKPHLWRKSHAAGLLVVLTP